jgi:hypothetical protein
VIRDDGTHEKWDEMTRSPAVADEDLGRALSFYAGMVEHILTHPERWLGLDDDSPAAKLPLRALDAVRDRAFGKTTPASPQWSGLPLQRRIDWWLRRIAVSAGLAAAAPRLAGALADRVPLQAALGASASGLAVCATARELGVASAAEWVPLLATVLFDRTLTAPAPVPSAAETEQQLRADGGEDDEAQAETPGKRSGARRAAGTVWKLARTLYGLQGLLDERPRGGLLARVVAKLPVVGVAGGLFDERAAIRKASRRTRQIVTGRR